MLLQTDHYASKVTNYARIIWHKANKTERSAAEKLRVCGSAKDLVEPPQASSPEFYLSLEIAVSGKLPVLFVRPHAVACVTCACAIGRRAKFAELCQHYAQCFERSIMLKIMPA